MRKVAKLNNKQANVLEDYKLDSKKWSQKINLNKNKWKEIKRL